MKKKLAILGCGNMGSAIADGLSGKASDFAIRLYDPTPEKSSTLARKTGGKEVSSMAELETCDTFLIACKPQHFGDLAENLKPVLTPEKVVVSIMAGISSATLAARLGVPKIARVMPNTPCLVREGVAAIYFSETLNRSEKESIEKIFLPIARVFRFHSDREIDIATALTGSGPAYFFEIARVLADSATALGLNAADAEAMTKQLIRGSATLMLQSKDSLEILRDNVTSKGGTTQAALETFQKLGLEKTLQAGLEAAFKRAQELSRSSD